MKLDSLIGHVVELYSEIMKIGKPADRMIDLFFRERKYLGSHDRRFIAETTYGMLRHKRRNEWITSQWDGGNSVRSQCIASVILDNQFTLKELSHAVNIPELNLSELQRLIQNDPVSGKGSIDVALTYSFQDWMIDEWMKIMPEAEVGILCATLNTQAPMTIRVNTIKTTREECKTSLMAEGIPSSETLYSPFGLQMTKRTNLFTLQAFKDGLFEVQDEGSQILSLVVDPKPGSKVVDACAGAGGKSLAMASVMKNRGEIFAYDVHSYRMADLHKRIKRSGVDCIRMKVIQEHELVEAMKDSADAVLVDAPCTGTGTIRRNPGLKWSVDRTSVDELSTKQYSILSLNSQYVKPGGRLVYATCSLMQQENEQVVERFLADHSEFELTDPAEILRRYHLESLANKKYVQLLPHERNTDGYFAAVLKRKFQ